MDLHYYDWNNVAQVHFLLVSFFPAHLYLTDDIMKWIIHSECMNVRFCMKQITLVAPWSSLPYLISLSWLKHARYLSKNAQYLTQANALLGFSPKHRHRASYGMRASYFCTNLSQQIWFGLFSQRQNFSEEKVHRKNL